MNAADVLPEAASAPLKPSAASGLIGTVPLEASRSLKNDTAPLPEAAAEAAPEVAEAAAAPQGASILAGLAPLSGIEALKAALQSAPKSVASATEEPHEGAVLVYKDFVNQHWGQMLFICYRVESSSRF